MTLNWFQSLIFGLISGFSEFIPVSSEAQGVLVARFFGVKDVGQLLRLSAHLGCLIAVFIACRPHISRIIRERRIASLPHKQRKRQPDVNTLMDWRLLVTATIPMLAGFALYPWVGNQGSRLWILFITMIINGIVLYAPQFIPGANKLARNMNRVDGFLIGLSGAFGVVPGLSRVALLTSAASVRGTDREYALQTALLLCIPALLVLIAVEFSSILAFGIGGITVGTLICALCSFVSAFIGGCFGVVFVKFLSVRTGFSFLAFYCWGAALLSIILYLMT